MKNIQGVGMKNKNFDLSGVPETMLIPMYARYLESKRKKRDFYDLTAVRVIESMNCDCKRFGKSKLNMWGCAARTTILDTLVKEYVKRNPKAYIVNIGCGLDDRFRRVDNGNIHWYNIDLPEVIKIRESIIKPHKRVVNISKSILDFSWIDEIVCKSEILFICEGVLMYFEEEEVRELFDTISNNFEYCTLLLELMSKWIVENQKLHDVAKKTTAKFKWGVVSSEDFVKLCPKYKKAQEYGLTSAMKKYSPIIITLLGGFLKTRNNMIVEFKSL